MGLEAALKRVPDGGCLLIEYCSHTGFDYEGTLGRVVRYDKQAGLFAPPIRTMREPLECYESLVGLPDRKTFGGDELEEPVEERVEDRVEEGKQDGGGNETGVQFGASPVPNDANDAALAAARAIQKIRDAKEAGTGGDVSGLFQRWKPVVE
jgi:hypothetical protein